MVGEIVDDDDVAVANDLLPATDSVEGPCCMFNGVHGNIEVASDGSNSDMDWSDDGRGGVYITYGWSNQVSFSNMFLAAAEVRNATQQEWLESFFDD